MTQPRITGIPEYASLLDVPAYVAFLRARGMRDAEIERLTVKFVYKVRHLDIFQLNALGIADLFSPIIQIATYWIDKDNPDQRSSPTPLSDFRKKSQQDILSSFNATLIHETRHILDHRKWWLYLSVLLEASALIWTAYGLRYLIDSWLQVSPVLDALISVVFTVVSTIVSIRLLLWWNPFEVRARAFEKRWTDRIMLFRIP